MSSRKSDGFQLWGAVVAIGVILGIIASLITLYVFFVGTPGSRAPASEGGSVAPTWRNVPSFSSGAHDILLGIAALAPNDIWAIGDFSTDGHIYQGLTEHWDGGTWRQVASANPGADDTEPISLAARPPHALWAVGSYTNSGFIRTLVLRLGQ